MKNGTGFSSAQTRWPWTDDSSILGVEPFDWSLDGGGRILIDQMIETNPYGLLLEIGSFMGGSARRWLKTNPHLKCICVDPWGDNLVTYTRGLLATEWALRAYGAEALERYASLLEKYGPVRLVRNNLHEFRDRCVMVQSGAPQIFAELKKLRIKPTFVFLDAMKRREEFMSAQAAFPDMIIAGDDWSWKDPAGTFPVREFVEEIALMRGGSIYAQRQTFVISEPKHRLRLDEAMLYSPAC